MCYASNAQGSADESLVSLLQLVLQPHALSKRVFFDVYDPQKGCSQPTVACMEGVAPARAVLSSSSPMDQRLSLMLDSAALHEGRLTK